MATATQKFAEIQAANEVLSDPQERAWYDSHRDAILSGNDGPHGDDQPTTFRNVRLTSTEEILSLMREFNATIPFDDGPKGFFGITRETFEHLALEEEACDPEDGNCPHYPTFGFSEDDYESVVKPFYGSWAGFSTRKSFAWKDKYRLTDAPDRRVRRLMEKENKKIREDAAREFNVAVRFLVLFVRKRDPRYLPNTQTDAQRQKSMREAPAAQAAKARAMNQEKLKSYEMPEWTRPQEDSAEEGHFSQTEEESEVEVLECIVCNKSFKSENQLEAHERSKKHIKALQQLRRQMRKEGTELDLESRPQSNPVDPSRSDIGDKTDEDSTLDRETPQGGRGNQDNERSGQESTASSDEDPSLNPLCRDDSQEDDDYVPRTVVQDRLCADPNSRAKTHAENLETDSELSIAMEGTSIQTDQPERRIGKAKAKRERKAAQRTAETHDVRLNVWPLQVMTTMKLLIRN